MCRQHQCQIPPHRWSQRQGQQLAAAKLGLDRAAAQQAETAAGAQQGADKRGIVHLDAQIRRQPALGHPTVEQTARGVWPARQDQRQAREILNADEPTPAREAVGPADHEDRLLHQWHCFEAALRQRVVQAGQVHLTAHQPFMNVAAVAADHFQKYLRVQRHEALDQRRDQECPGSRGNREADRAGQPSGDATELRPRLLELAQDRLAARQQRSSGVGQGDAVAVADKQLGAQLSLQPRDLAAERRL